MKRNLLAIAALALLGAAPTRPLAKATFAGGCFWCMEPPFEGRKGVISVTSGYTGGRIDKPTYEEVSAGYTGHREAVEIVFDPALISYQVLLNIYWHNVDPFDHSGQFCDHGGQYRTAIFVHDAEQKRLAEASKQAVGVRFHRDVTTDILPAGRFYPAEEYHQDYYKKNPLRYKFYRFNCGRDQRLRELWKSEG
ncbi:MAG: peptide-methionine (S)-S-oxide reductase [Thermoanaerobaculia bacterium]|jgi:peptide-methionine (S)-S-oxide reductase|nr:peptide-methionine (S)-S-oxide reductase [Thermoanaerobaculia bacterium]